MKSIKTFVAALALVASTGLSYAGCDFFEHNDRQGKKLALKDGECAVLAGDSTAGCEGLPAKFVEGWNDIISSVTLNHNSTAILKQHADGSGSVATIVGNRGMAAIPDFNDEASVVLCRQ